MYQTNKVTKHGSLVGAMDQGTSSSRFLIFTPSSELLTYHQIEVPRLCPRNGWVEQDPLLLLNATLTCVDKAIENMLKLGFDPKEIKAIGITNQRETIIAWDKFSGAPLYNAIVWMDARTTSQVDAILSNPNMTKTVEKITRLCGLPISTYFSALKIKWLLDNVAGIKTALEEDRLLIGTVDSWLIWNLTGGKSNGLHMTDVTNASRTMLMNLETCQWDPFLLNFFKIPKKILPTIKSSSEIYGYLERTNLKGVAISGCLGDQQAALVGQSCLKPGQAKCTYGTGCFLLFNTGTKPIQSRHGLLTTVAYKFGPSAAPSYALEGSIGVAGAAIRWLRDNLGIAQSYEEVDELASSVENGGVYFVPAFSGLLAPYWRPDARGVICGLTEHSTKAHIARASYEAVSFQVKDLLEAMNAEGSFQLTSLRVDGGMTANKSLMQLQADLLGIKTIRPIMSETSALGAAMAAGAAEGIKCWDLNGCEDKEVVEIYEPKMAESDRNEKYWKWKEAVKRSCGWEIKPEINKTDKRHRLLSSIPPSWYFISTFAMLWLSDQFSTQSKSN